MLTRRALISLAFFTLVCFLLAGGLGNDREGVLRVIADLSWYGFLLGLLFLIVGSVFVLVRSSARRRAT